MNALALGLVLASVADLTVSTPRGQRRVPIVMERGFAAVAAAPLAAALAWESVPSPAGTATLRIAGASFVFVLDAGYFRSNDRVYTLESGPYLARDSLFLPLQFVTEHLPRLTGKLRYDAATSRLEEVTPEPPTRRRLVAIDAGHGGIDVGMTGPLGAARFLREKDVTLAIARHLAAELRTRGFGIVMTRERDTLIARDDRGAIAGRARADIFVSIHVNAANPGWRNAARARGFETYFLAEARTEDEARVARMENSSVRFETSARARRGDPMSFILTDLAQNEHLRESSQMAEAVQRALARVHPAENRGVKQAPFAVLSTSYMPAILVETGFGSNLAEARYLTSATGQQRLARAIAEGLERYLTEYERRVASVGAR